MVANPLVRRPVPPRVPGRTGVAVTFAAVALLVAGGCGGESGRVVSGRSATTREVTRAPGPPPPAEAVRLRVAPPESSPAASPTPAWVVDLPPRWRRVPPRPFRDVNLAVDGEPDVECYLTVTERGSLLDNVNRWRAQVGLGPLDEDGADALPTELLAGGEARFVDLRGTVRAMQSTLEGARLLGLIRVAPGEVLTLKLTGPADAVEALREDFLSVAAGLRRGESRPIDEPRPPSGHGSAAAAPTSGDGLRWRVPDGWIGGPQVPFAAASLSTPGTPPVHLTVSRFRNDGGGFEENVARWAAQVGRPAPDAGEIERAERIEVLGRASPLLRFDGAFRTRDGRTVEDTSIVVVWIAVSDGSVVVKAVGRRVDVDAALDAIRAFARSIEAAP